MLYLCSYYCHHAQCKSPLMQNFCRIRNSYFALLALCVGLGGGTCRVLAEQTQADADEEAAYTRAIAGRSAGIVEKLGLEDAEQNERVQSILMDQYRNLRDLHDSRDAKLARLRENGGDQSEDAVKQLREETEIEQYQLHRAFLARLSAELTPEQVVAVKDGMTYGVVPNTYQRYLEILPDLADEEKRHIKALLIEAREYAMDGGSSEEKHGWFREYKGKINNYLSSRGYDLKAAEKRAE